MRIWHASPEELAELSALIDRWTIRERDSNELLVNVEPHPEDRRWIVRMGGEDAVYLVGQMPLSALDEPELDRIVGSAYAYSEQYFAPAMSIGYESKFRR